MWKAVEVVLIWAVAIVLAVPEAIAFDMVELSYWEQHLWVCMLASEQKSSFMMVGTLSHRSCSARERETRATRVFCFYRWLLLIIRVNTGRATSDEAQNTQHCSDMGQTCFEYGARKQAAGPQAVSCLHHPQWKVKTHLGKFQNLPHCPRRSKSISTNCLHG